MKKKGKSIEEEGKEGKRGKGKGFTKVRGSQDRIHDVQVRIHNLHNPNRCRRGEREELGQRWRRGQLEREQLEREGERGWLGRQELGRRWLGQQ